ncbi:MAG: hypothetical protein JNN07_07820, partial [Verrucomicrobiales bacterium]|nr:hypothetical protein [Verrucomicrobiales bacterium]
MNNLLRKSAVMRHDSGSLHFAFVLVSLWLLTPPSISAVQVSPGQTSVLYVNKFFEVRDHDVPTKYVWNGSTRVARVTGSLTDTPRQQRLRVYAGWNLVSLAVSLSNASEQLLKGGVADAAFLWNRSTRLWEPVGLGGSLPSGSVLWLRSKQEATVSLRGVQLPPGPQSLAGEGDFVSNNDLEALSLSSILSPVTTNAAMFAYEAWSRRWISWLPPPLGDLAAEPPCLAPGEALFVRAENSIALSAPDDSLRIRYFHQDHLGSSSCVSDSRGGIVEETAMYPFGAARNDFQPRGVQENYQFTQKERDKETALDYFEARYLSAGLGRFASVDPLLLGVPPELLATPQALNAYAYTQSNPLNLLDPTGTESVAEWIAQNGIEAARRDTISGDAEAGVWATADAVWSVFGSEGVSRLSDAAFNGGRELSARDYVGAGVEVVSVLPVGRLVRAARTLIGIRAGEAAVGVTTRVGGNALAADSGAFSRLAQPGGLTVSENAGGHLLARHVGQTEAQLGARLSAQPGIPAASTFVTRAEAEAAVSGAFNANA